MKFGVRKPSIKRSISARTTGKLKRSVKKAVNPLYGKKGMGYINDPKKAVYNKVYNKTTVGVKDIINSNGSNSKKANGNTNTYSAPANNTTSANSGSGCFRYFFAVAFIILGLFTLPVGLIFIGVGIVLLVCKNKSTNTNANTNTTNTNEPYTDFTREAEDNVTFSVSIISAFLFAKY